jgi:hypothetical protein
LKKQPIYSSEISGFLTTWLYKTEARDLHTHRCKNLEHVPFFYRPRGQSSSPDRGEIVLFFTSSRPVLGPTQPPIQWLARVKRSRREADHSPPTIVEVKNTWNLLS